MAVAECPHHKPRHDLVAHAETQHGIEHIVRQSDRGRKRDRVAAEQRQFHAGRTLRDAVAHRRHAARKLRHGTGCAHRLLDHSRIGFERLMGREHVVVGRHDRDVRHRLALESRLVVARARGKAVCEIGAAETETTRDLLRVFVELRQIGRPALGTARDDLGGDVGDDGMDHQASSSCQVRPSRSIKAVAAAGPQPPAT